jgi:hypothetical protein
MRKVLALPYLSYDARGIELPRKKVSCIMSKPDTHEHKQGGFWTWMIVGLLYSAVLAALYGPFIWDLMYSS